MSRHYKKFIPGKTLQGRETTWGKTRKNLFFHFFFNQIQQVYACTQHIACQHWSLLFTRTTKYLDTILDSSLSFKVHINFISKKLSENAGLQVKYHFMHLNMYWWSLCFIIPFSELLHPVSRKGSPCSKKKTFYTFKNVAFKHLLTLLCFNIKFKQGKW